MNGYFEVGNNFYFIPCLEIMAKYNGNTADLSTINKLIGNQYNKFTKVNFVRPQNAFPVEVSLFLSGSCNLKCSYCYYSSGGESKEDDLDVDKVNIIISYLIKNAKIRKLTGLNYMISVLLTGGGEPTYNWDIFSYFVLKLRECAQAHDIPVEISLVTNGILREKQIDFICKYIDFIQISYDGSTELQNKNRSLADGRSSSCLVEQTMRTLSYKRKNFFVRSTVLPCDYIKIYDMVKEVFETYSYAIKYHIEPIQYIGRANSIKRDTQENNDIFIEEYIRTQKMVIEKYPGRKFYSTIFKYKMINISCSSITGESPVINNCGKIYPCSDRLNFKTHGIGEIHDGKIEISNVSFFEEQYNKLVKTECGSCKYFSLCGGGCYSLFKRDSTGELLPEGRARCSLLKGYWNIVFKNLCSDLEFLELYLLFDRKENNWDIYKIKCR